MTAREHPKTISSSQAGREETGNYKPYITKPSGILYAVVFLTDRMIYHEANPDPNPAKIIAQSP